MSKIFSCGEVGSMKLVLNVDKHKQKMINSSIDEKFNTVLDLNNKKNKNKIEKQKGKKQELKLATGSKVIKIDNMKDLKELIGKYYDDPTKAEGAEASVANNFFENLSKDYQGIYVTKGVIERNPKFRFITGDKEGLRILDKEALRDINDKNPKPFRTGMNGSAKNLSKEGKKIDNEAYKSRKNLEVNKKEVLKKSENSKQKIEDTKEVIKKVSDALIKKEGNILKVDFENKKSGNGKYAGLKGTGKVLKFTPKATSTLSKDEINISHTQIEKNIKLVQSIGKTPPTKEEAVKAEIQYQEARKAIDKNEIKEATEKLANSIKNNSTDIDKQVRNCNKAHSHLIKSVVDNVIKVDFSKGTKDVMEGKVAALSHGNSKVIDFNSKLGRVPVNTITNKSVIQAITPSDRIVPIGSSTKINTNLERGSINSNSSINQGNKVVNFPNPKTNKTNTKTSTANTKINNIVSIVNSRRKSETSS